MATNSTAAVGRRQAESVSHAVRFANDNGHSLNFLVTINFSLLGISDADAGRAFQRVMQSLVRWWGYQRTKGRLLGTFMGYAVHENPNALRNVHWVMQVPDDAREDIEAAIT